VTDRSGCGLTELTILRAVAALSTGREGPPSVTVLDEVDRRIGLGPSYAYPMVCDLSKPWVIPLPLLAITGNAGDRTFPEGSGPVHTLCRLSRVGEVIMAAEAGTIAPVPTGLINGTWWRGGTQPPLDPVRVITALRHLIDDPQLPDNQLLQITGGPISATGSELTGDFDALARGLRITIREAVRITRTDTPVPPTPAGPPRDPAKPVSHGHLHSQRPRQRPVHLIIDSVPRQISATDLGEQIKRPIRAENWDPPYPPAGTPPDIDSLRDRLTASAVPIAQTHYASTERDIRLEISLRPGSDPDRALAQLARMDDLAVELAAQFPAPLTDLLRSWADDHRHEDLTTSLDQLQAAIQADQLDQPNDSE
jgi:hypothetical protein